MIRKMLFTAMLGLSLSANAQHFEIGDIPACTSVTPAAVALTNTPISLDVRVLMDGVSRATAEQIMNGAAVSYAPLGITVVNSYQAVNFSGAEAANLIAQAKSYYGGVRPAGIDIVYVLTSKDVVDGASGSSALAGLADCIGGVKYNDRAFAVGEAKDSQPINLLLYTLDAEASAKTAAHEIGHLMGGHHHYANCAESALNIGGAPCTVMFNVNNVGSDTFSLLNGIVVRGHAQAYAKP